MKVWVFGDSFAELKSKDIKGWEWQLQVSKFFESDLYNITHNGASSEWLTLQLFNCFDKICIDDFVIVLIPYWDRQCIFPEDPDLAHLATLDQCNTSKEKNKWQNYTKDQQDAFKKYFMYLYNIDLVKLKTLSLYVWVNNLQLKNPPLIIETRDQLITPNFEKKYKIANGNLMDISVSEWISDEIWINLTSKSLYDDHRISHLCEKNHNILASKIIHFFNDKLDVDLTSNFYSKFLNKDCVDISKE